MLLPGPEAQQLAIYVGWLLHRTAGGIVAGSLFVLPGSLVMLALSWLYAAHGHLFWVEAIFYGLRAAVLAIVAAAVLRIGAKALRHPVMIALAAAAFVAIFFFKVPFPAIVIGAGLLGLGGGRVWPNVFGSPRAAIAGGGETTLVDDHHAAAEHTRPTAARAARVVAIGLLLWWGPLAAVAWWRGTGDVLTNEAIYFSKAAMVTFGGAYAVLPYVRQAAVDHYAWLVPGQMLDGLGLAETTPGPLILVAEFVGFLAAWGHPGNLSPLVAGTLGAAVTLWATFAPCFLWIFLGAPFIEHLRGRRSLDAALNAITASVVGVILNLAVWFGLHALFGTVSEHHVAALDPFALALAVVAFIGMRWYRWGIIPVVLGSAAAGFLVRSVF
jgi:chromate transporter